MRTFIAVEIPDELKPKIIAIQKKIAASGADIKLVEPENLHYILRFLGEIDQPTVEKAKTALSGISFPAFDIHITGIGAFPSKSYVRVVWLGCKQGTQEITGLAAAIEDVLAAIGIPKDSRAFTPHLTLGRIRTAQAKDALAKMLNELENTDIGTAHIDKLILFESKLSPVGPTYTPLLKVPLV
jgi:2'-5' RNA ligase